MPMPECLPFGTGFKQTGEQVVIVEQRNALAVRNQDACVFVAAGMTDPRHLEIQIQAGLRC